MIKYQTAEITHEGMPTIYEWGSLYDTQARAKQALTFKANRFRHLRGPQTESLYVASWDTETHEKTPIAVKHPGGSWQVIE